MHAKSLQSGPILYDSMDCSPQGSSDSPGKNTGADCYALLQGNLPDPGIKPLSLISPALAGRFLPLVPPGKPRSTSTGTYKLLQMVKNLPVILETQVWSLGWKDPLEKGMANNSSILAWRIPWILKFMAGCSHWNHKGSDTIELLTFSLSFVNILG